VLIYDLEIEKLIPPKNEPREEGFEYCEGWTDHEGMGMSVAAAFDYREGVPRIFFKDNLEELMGLMDRAEKVIGFNNKHFDDKLMAAHGYLVNPDKSWDLYLAIKEAAGAHKFAKGYNLDNCCLVNLGLKKSGSGELAPKLWQQGKIGQVADYCLRDVAMTKMLLDMCISQPILDPGNPSTRIFVKSPLDPL
jgi:hypothetical protein